MGTKQKRCPFVYCKKKEISMIKKTVSYVDYDGNDRVENFYFNLTQTELTDLSVKHSGGLNDYIQSIIDAKDVKELYSLFKEIIDMSYGKKSEDGRRFMKSQEILDDFKQTLAYDKLVVSLANDEEEAAAFIKGVIPSPEKK
jgi:hypothetical protein